MWSVTDIGGDHTQILVNKVDIQVMVELAMLSAMVGGQRRVLMNFDTGFNSAFNYLRYYRKKWGDNYKVDFCLHKSC